MNSGIFLLCYVTAKVAKMKANLREAEDELVKVLAGIASLFSAFFHGFEFLSICYELEIGKQKLGSF